MCSAYKRWYLMGNLNFRILTIDIKNHYTASGGLRYTASKVFVIQLPGCTLWSWSPRPTNRPTNSKNTITSSPGIFQFSSRISWNNSKCNPLASFMIKNLKYQYISISYYWAGCYICDFQLLRLYNVDRKMNIIKISWYFRNKRMRWFGLIGFSASEYFLFLKHVFWMPCNIPKQHILSFEIISQHLKKSVLRHIEIFR